METEAGPMAEGESKKAESLFKRAIEADPGNSVSPWANLVLAYARDFQVDKTLGLAETLDDYEAVTFYDWLFKAEAQQVGNWGVGATVGRDTGGGLIAERAVLGLDRRRHVSTGVTFCGK